MIYLLFTAVAIFDKYLSLILNPKQLLRTFFISIIFDYYLVFMRMDRADFDITTGQLQNQGYFQGVYCNTADSPFYIQHCNITDHCFYIICGVAIHTVNSLEIQ